MEALIIVNLALTLVLFVMGLEILKRLGAK